MDEKNIQSDWIGEDTTAKSDVDLRKLINMQKTYISTLEEGINLRDELIKKYEKIIHLHEKKIELLENLLNVKNEMNKKLVRIIGDYKALCRGLAGLEDEASKGCSTCKHVYCRGDREPCKFCNRCILNSRRANNFEDKWEPK